MERKTPQEALLEWTLGILRARIDPDEAPDPQAYLLARTLSDLARMLSPGLRARVAQIPASEAEARLLAVAYSAVGPLGYRVVDADGGEVPPPAGVEGGLGALLLGLGAGGSGNA